MQHDPAADKCCSLGGKFFRANQEIAAGTSWAFFPFYQIYSAYTVLETTATDSLRVSEANLDYKNKIILSTRGGKKF